MWLHIFPLREWKDHGLKLPFSFLMDLLRLRFGLLAGSRFEARKVALLVSFFKHSNEAHLEPTNIVLNSFARRCCSSACKTSSMKRSLCLPSIIDWVMSWLLSSSHLWKNSFNLSFSLYWRRESSFSSSSYYLLILEMIFFIDSTMSRGDSSLSIFMWCK